jgi:CRISPR/Cas system CSM-associated protein Csm2 small subunit
MILQKKTASTLMLLSLAFTFASCEMMDNAKTAAENSGKAAKNSGIAAKAAGDSREEIANSRLMARSGAASASRREALEGIIAMDSMSMKITEASKYVKAFEFQLWTGQRYDTQAYKERMYEDAMSELFRSVEELYGKQIAGAELSPFKALNGAKNKNMNVYALAVSMHGVHQVQTVATTNNSNSSEESIYDIIKNSLKSIKDIETGVKEFSTLKEHEVVVYNYKEEALALIQARYNMLLTMNLAKVSELKKSAVSGLSLLYFRKTFESKITNLNLGEQKEANKYLDAAVKVKTFMSEIGEVMITNDKVAKLYSKMRIANEDSTMIYDVTTMEQRERNANLEEHKSLLDKLGL